MTRKRAYEFHPVGWDVFDARHNIEPGTLVVKTKVPGCPPNGTMGHCFIAHADTGKFIGLVLLNSLKPAGTVVV
jgi:hypothetical protein